MSKTKADPEGAALCAAEGHRPLPGLGGWCRCGKHQQLAATRRGGMGDARHRSGVSEASSGATTSTDETGRWGHR